MFLGSQLHQARNTKQKLLCSPRSTCHQVNGRQVYFELLDPATSYMQHCFVGLVGKWRLLTEG